ncbi:MAG: DUF1669 domain-containing protein [Deltaproteobacteria bacterium]|nr:DUF1669 domain-containing protein [Deltaproteobacteria bacterium]
MQFLAKWAWLAVLLVGVGLVAEAKDSKTYRDEILLSGDVNPIAATRAAIDAAEVSVDAAIYKFDAKPLRRALERALERGVRVRIVVDAGAAHKGGAAAKVGRAGARMRKWTRGKLHTKFAVIDGRRVLTGSYNWTDNAGQENVELLMSFQDPDDVRRFAELFEKLWKSAGKK